MSINTDFIQSTISVKAALTNNHPPQLIWKGIASKAFAHIKCINESSWSQQMILTFDKNQIQRVDIAAHQELVVSIKNTEKIELQSKGCANEKSKSQLIIDLYCTPNSPSLQRSTSFRYI